MDIDNFKIEIKKYDEQKHFVIVNVIVLDTIELRGFTVRYTTTKYSHGYPVWLVSPPTRMDRNKIPFWIVRILDSTLWQQLQRAIIKEAEKYTNLL